MFCNDYFSTNKFLLELAKQRFVENSVDLSLLVVEFSKEYSNSRFKFCENFRLFGNAKYSWCAGGETDIKALCQAITTGYQDAEARRFKNSILSRTQEIVFNNDKKAFFESCQSIYRSAQQNAPVIYNLLSEDISLQTEYDFYEYEEHKEDIDKTLYDFYFECGSLKIKAGNTYIKKSSKKAKKHETLSLF